MGASTAARPVKSVQESISLTGTSSITDGWLQELQARTTQAQAIRETLRRCPEYQGHLEQHHMFDPELTPCLTSGYCFLTFPFCKTEGITYKHLGKRLWSRGLSSITPTDRPWGIQPTTSSHWLFCAVVVLLGLARHCCHQHPLASPQVQPAPGWLPSQTPKLLQIIIVMARDFRETMTFKGLFEHSVKKNLSLLKLKNKPFLYPLFAN